MWIVIPDLEPLSNLNLIGNFPLFLALPVRLHSHPWETVTQAAWRKYPNPISQGVIGTDVVERQVVDGVLHTHRLVQSKWFIPKWAQKVQPLQPHLGAVMMILKRDCG